MEKQTYFHGTGRRKCAVAQVRLMAGTGAIIVNGAPFEKMFPSQEHQRVIRQPLVLTETAEKRLKVIQEYDELGAGLKIAMKDLEIRGAGNILGRSFCPLGAIYALTSWAALARVRLKPGACVQCGACSRVCPIDLDVPREVGGPECIACGDCIGKRLRQVVTACGDGATAAFSAQLYIEAIRGESYL
jgi:ferredoxin